MDCYFFSVNWRIAVMKITGKYSNGIDFGSISGSIYGSMMAIL